MTYQLLKDDLEVWLSHPITKCLMNGCTKLINDTGAELIYIQGSLYHGRFNAETAALKNSALSGRNSALTKVLELVAAGKQKPKYRLLIEETNEIEWQDLDGDKDA